MVSVHTQAQTGQKHAILDEVMDEFLKTLSSRITGDITTDEATLRSASRDTSLFELKPLAVIVPKNVSDITTIVRAVGEHEGWSLTARSGGTGMDGGALSESIVLDMTKYFSHIKGFTQTTGTVEPGVFFRDFDRESMKRGLLMPSYPASRELCTVGGMVANNAGGELTLAYGKTADYIRELRVVLSDGNEYTFGKLSHEALEQKLLQKDFEGDLYRRMYALVKNNQQIIQDARPQVTKNSSGYALWDVYDPHKETLDLTRLFTGSQGTLGIITEITFDLVPPDPHSQMMILFLDSFEGLGELVKTVLAHTPTTFESYDDKTLRLALRFFVQFVKRLGFKNIFTLLKGSIPEALSIARHGLPKLVLQITFDGKDPVLLKKKAEMLAKELAMFKPRYVEILKNKKEMEEYWLIRRESFNLLRHKSKHVSTAPFIDDIVVPPRVLSEFLPKLYAILNEYNDYMIHNIAGHIGNGNFHIIPLMNLSDENVRKVIPEIAQKVYNLVFSYKGSASGEHNDGIIRTPFLRQQFGDDMYKLFEQTKNIFDPKGIFNPGKKVRGSLEYALKHLHS